MSTSEHEPALRLLRDSRAQLQAKIEKIDTAIAAVVSVFGDVSVVEPTPAKRQASKPAAPVRAKGRGQPRLDRAGLEALILAFLQKQKTPVTFAAVVDGCAGVSDATLRPVVKVLVARGAVVQTGATISRRLGLPAVMAAGAPAKEAVQRG